MFKGAVETVLADRMKVIWYNWVVIQVLVFIYTICAFAAAAQSSSKGFGFLVIWTMFMALAYAGGGTMILRRLEYRTPLAVGFLIGVGACMINIMLITATICGANLATFNTAKSPQAQDAVQAFAVMLLLAYSTFTGFTVVYRDTLLPPPAMAGQDMHEGLPPGQPAYGQYDGGASHGAGPAFSNEGAGGYSDGGAAGGAAVL